MRDRGSTSYSGAIESVASRETDRQLSSIAQRAELETCRHGFEHTQRQVILGDRAN